jgi:hypothetical protein
LREQDLEAVMSSIVIGYRQMELQQMEIPKPSVARFEWVLWGARNAVIARGPIFVFGQKTQLPGWRAEHEYWYVAALGVAAPPERFSVECQDQVPIEQAGLMLAPYSPSNAFVAPMVPSPQTLSAGDPVLQRASMHGVARGNGDGDGLKLATDAALYIELDGRAIRRIDWYWSGTEPLSLFPGGAQKGARVDLNRIDNGSPGFPQVGWHKCEQAA